MARTKSTLTAAERYATDKVGCAVVSFKNGNPWGIVARKCGRNMGYDSYKLVQGDYHHLAQIDSYGVLWRWATDPEPARKPKVKPPPPEKQQAAAIPPDTKEKHRCPYWAADAQNERDDDEEGGYDSEDSEYSAAGNSSSDEHWQEDGYAYDSAFSDGRRSEGDSEDDSEDSYDSDGFADDHSTCSEGGTWHSTRDVADPPIVKFARVGNEASVLSCLSRGVPIDSRGSRHEEQESSHGDYSKEFDWPTDTALLAACREGHASLVKALLERGAKADVSSCVRNDVHDTPLSVAIQGKHDACVQLITQPPPLLAKLKAKKDAEAKSELAAQRRASLEKMTVAELRAVALELQPVESVPALKKALKKDVVDYVVSEEAKKAAAAVVPPKPKKPNWATCLRLVDVASSGNTPAHVDSVLSLLSRGVPVNTCEVRREAEWSAGSYVTVQTSNQDTALVAACRRGHSDIAKILLENGANPEHISRRGIHYPEETAFGVARKGHSEGHRVCARLLAAQPNALKALHDKASVLEGMITQYFDETPGNSTTAPEGVMDSLANDCKALADEFFFLGSHIPDAEAKGATWFCRSLELMLKRVEEASGAMKCLLTSLVSGNETITPAESAVCRTLSSWLLHCKLVKRNVEAYIPHISKMPEAVKAAAQPPDFEKRWRESGTAMLDQVAEKVKSGIIQGSQRSKALSGTAALDMTHWGWLGDLAYLGSACAIAAVRRKEVEGWIDSFKASEERVSSMVFDDRISWSSKSFEDSVEVPVRASKILLDSIRTRADEGDAECATFLLDSITSWDKLTTRAGLVRTKVMAAAEKEREQARAKAIQRYADDDDDSSYDSYGGYGGYGGENYGFYGSYSYPNRTPTFPTFSAASSTPAAYRPANVGRRIVAYSGGELWGTVTGDIGTAYKLDSGRVAKKRTEGTMWRWEAVKPAIEAKRKSTGEVMWQQGQAAKKPRTEQCKFCTKKFGDAQGVQAHTKAKHQSK